jgi:predicted deacylase
MRSMDIREFDPREIEQDTKEAIYLDTMLTSGGMPVRQTVLVVSGTEPGPVLVVSGGVHGDEYEGPLTIIRLFKELEPADIRGTFVGLVVANVPAFEAGTRCSPVDGLNLARVFPGDPNGSVTQQIAHWMGDRFIGRADFYIDLHSSGSDTEMPQLCGYLIGAGPTAQLCKRVAEAFHTEAVWARPEQPPGRTLRYAVEHDIPAVYTECPASRCVSLPDVEAYQRGVRNAMRVLDMLDGELEGEPSRYYLYGGSNLESMGITVTKSGYFVPGPGLLDWVEADHLLGTVLDLAGNVLEEIRAPTSGCVVMRQLLPTVHAGKVVYTLAEHYQGQLSM